MEENQGKKTTKKGEKFVPLRPEEEEGTRTSLRKFSPVLIPLAIAALVSYVLIGYMAVDKATFNNAAIGLTQAVNDVAGLKTQIQDIGTNVLDIETTLTALVEDTELELANLRNDTITLKAQVKDTGDIEASLATYSNSVTQLDNRIGTLERAIPDLIGYAKLTDLDEYATLDDYIALVATIELLDPAEDIDLILTSFEDRIADMEELLEELELMVEEGEAIVTDECTVWTREVYTTYATNIIKITHTVSPHKIEDDGDYILMVYLYNYDLTTKTDVIVDIILSPKTGDRVKVDESELYLDSTRSPFYDWFAQTVKRSDGTCRRIVFSSEHIAIPAGEEVTIEGETVIYPGRITLRLELTLAYE